MQQSSTATLLAVLFASLAFAGCLSNGNDMPDYDSSSISALLDPANGASQLQEALFEESIVDALADRTGDLYEPTIDVCDDGSIYITGHTIAVDTTGAPVAGSHDDGETWVQLPWFQDQSLPGRQVQGSTPPVSDEIFLSCGDDGWLYGVDITLASYPVNAWSNFGTEHSYWNFNAYDETKVAQQAGECDTGLFTFAGQDVSVPVQAPAKDRPWGAYANGKLLLISNPAGGPAQVGVMDVPLEGAPVSLGHIPEGIEWNLCAGPGGSIPGIGDIRDDGLFAVPQRNDGALTVTIGNADDVMTTTTTRVFDVTSISEITSWYGHSIFDAEGDLFVGITNNTRDVTCGMAPTPVTGEPGEVCTAAPEDGGFIISASTDGGETYVQTNFTFEGNPIRHWYMDANEWGPGVLAVWAIEDEETGFDWYIGHVQLDETGAPYLESVALAIDNGPRPSAHVTGAAVGPDGRAYIAMFEGGGSAQNPTWPLSVFIQRDGPTLPVVESPVELIEADE